MQVYVVLGIDHYIDTSSSGDGGGHDITAVLGVYSSDIKAKEKITAMGRAYDSYEIDPTDIDGE